MSLNVFLEILAVLFSVSSSYLLAKSKISGWYTGLISSALFLYLFYSQALVSSAFLQVFFLINCLVALYKWNNSKNIKPKKLHIVLLCIVLVFSYWFYTLLLLIFPLMQNNIMYLRLDAAYATLSIVASLLLTYKYTISWVFWIIVNILGIYLYYISYLYFASFLHLIYLFLAIYGYKTWKLESERRS